MASRMSARVARDIKEIMQDPPPGIFVIPCPDDISKLELYVIGPFDTPYEGGIFWFSIKFPDNYPFSPPKVRFRTTDGGRVRFNPNLYSNGKVCLSILGTWSGPQWSAAQSALTVALSIQSLLNNAPLRNEPGFEQSSQKSIDAYNFVVVHETLRVAVCAVLEYIVRDFEAKKSLDEFSNLAISVFNDFHGKYLEKITSFKKSCPKSVSTPMQNVQKFEWDGLRQRICMIKERLSALTASPPTATAPATSSSQKHHSGPVASSSSSNTFSSAPPKMSTTKNTMNVDYIASSGKRHALANGDINGAEMMDPAELYEDADEMPDSDMDDED